MSEGSGTQNYPADVDWRYKQGTVIIVALEVAVFTSPHGQSECIQTHTDPRCSDLPHIKSIQQAFVASCSTLQTVPFKVAGLGGAGTVTITV